MTGRKWAAGFLMVLALLWLPLRVQAGESQVADQAELLTSEEEENLTARMEEMEEKWKQTFVIVTTGDAQGKEARDYADDYYDSHGYGDNGVLYLIDLDNGELWISTAGSMIRFLTDARIQEVLDAGYEDISQGSYEAGLERMLDRTEKFLEDGIPSNQFSYDPETGEVSRYRSITGMEALLAAAVALAAGGIFFGAVCARYKMKTDTYTYPFRQKGRLSLTREEDILVNQVITHRRIPKSPPPGAGSGGGRSTVHTSLAGRSHGGGGRRL